MGDLTYIKIWHDNSGKGDDASWFLKFIIIHDLQTREKFYFLCQKWLAVEYDDGKIERRLFIAFEEQKTNINYLLDKQAKNYVIDHHLYLSVFIRPILSTFTCLDRVTCCFVFHYITMLLTILYYGNSNALTSINSAELDMSLFKINMEQVEIYFFLTFLFYKKI